MANFIKNVDDFGVVKTYEIEPEDWDSTNKTYTIEDELITVGLEESTQFISYNPALYDDDLYEELCNAGIRIYSVSAGEIVLKCTGDMPTSNLYLTVTFKASFSPSLNIMDSVPAEGSQNPITTTHYVTKDTSTAIVYETQYCTDGLEITYNEFLKIFSLRINSQIIKAVSNGTKVKIATVPSAVIEAIGRHNVYGTISSTNNVTIELFWSTYGDNGIYIQPRANLTANAWIYGCMTSLATH